MGDRLGTYAKLKTCEDQSNSVYQRMMGRFMQAASRAAQASSFIRPEILAIPSAKMDEFLEAPALAPYKLLLTRILRFKPHTLGQEEERLLAMQTEMAEAAGKIFRQLNDADIKFGTVKNEKGQQVELSHGSFIAFLEFARPRGSRQRLPHVLRAVHGPRAHAGGLAERLDPARHLLRQGPQLRLGPGGGACFPTMCRWRSTTT